MIDMDMLACLQVSTAVSVSFERSKVLDPGHHDQ